MPYENILPRLLEIKKELDSITASMASAAKEAHNESIEQNIILCNQMFLDLRDLFPMLREFNLFTAPLNTGVKSGKYSTYFIAVTDNLEIAFAVGTPAAYRENKLYYLPGVLDNQKAIHLLQYSSLQQEAEVALLKIIEHWPDTLKHIQRSLIACATEKMFKAYDDLISKHKE